MSLKRKLHCYRIGFAPLWVLLGGIQKLAGSSWWYYRNCHIIFFVVTEVSEIPFKKFSALISRRFRVEWYESMALYFFVSLKEGQLLDPWCVWYSLSWLYSFVDLWLQFYFLASGICLCSMNKNERSHFIHLMSCKLIL